MRQMAPASRELPPHWQMRVGIHVGPVMAGVVAIAWTLHNPAVTAAIVGGRSAKQVEGILPAAEFRLTEAEFGEIGDFIKSRP